jgi:hypothetical protein
MHLVKMIADQINADRSANIKRAYRILMAPRKVFGTLNEFVILSVYLFLFRSMLVI